MTQTNRFWKFVVTSILIIILCAAVLFGVIWHHLTPDQARVVFAIGQANLYLILILFFLVFGSLWVVFDITYNTYVKPIKRMSAEAGVIYTSNPSHRIIPKGGSDAVRLAQVINDFADMFENLNKTITEQILSARKETEKERNLLAAIMAEFPQGVIICNKSGRILLFNSIAQSIFSSKQADRPAEQFIGLGRSIFHLIEKDLVAHAMEEIREQMDTDTRGAGSCFITPVRSGGIISVETVPILDSQNRLTGFILALKEISQDIEKYETIDGFLRQFRGTLGRFAKAQETEGMANLCRQYRSISGAIRNLSFSRLPLTTLELRRFLPALQKKCALVEDIRLNVFVADWDKRFLADSFSFTQSLVFLIRHLSQLSETYEFSLEVKSHRDTIVFHLFWQGPALEPGAAAKAFGMKVGTLPKLGYILKFNNARHEWVTQDNDGWYTGISLISKSAPKAVASLKKTVPVLAGSRPEFYDFNLFAAEERPKNLLATLLKDLTFTVFDTETTGLNPEGGDEIISIGGVRIVNNRIVYQDTFEELVNPGRDIPMASYKIHGISYEMVREKPPIDTILPLFRQFVSDTVLLGHNIAFDMKMLKVKESLTGIAFENPVLDTLLLSAVLHPVHENHDMETIAKRSRRQHHRQAYGPGRCPGNGGDFFKTDPHFEQQRHIDPGRCCQGIPENLLRPIKVLILWKGRW